MLDNNRLAVHCLLQRNLVIRCLYLLGDGKTMHDASSKVKVQFYITQKIF
jgi:hypothetical protein